MSSADVAPGNADQHQPHDDTDVARGWHLWRSDDGHGAYYATRSGPRLTDGQIQSGLVMTLAADTPDGLLHLLKQQNALRGM